MYETKLSIYCIANMRGHKTLNEVRIIKLNFTINKLVDMNILFYKIINEC